MTPMHIAFLITRGDAVGGATVHVRDMARCLLDRGMRATVLVGGAGEVIDEFERFGIPYRTISSLGRAINPLRDLRALAQIAGTLRDLRPDLVSTHTAKAGLLGRLACRYEGIPVLFTPHGWAITDRISRTSGRIFRVCERTAAPWADAIVNVCEAERLLAEEHGIGPVSKLEVIHNGVRDIESRHRADPAIHPPRVVTVARFEAPKDHELLLRALATISGEPWTLELVGAGPLEAATRDLATSLGLAGRVHFSGPSAHVAECLGRTQIFVLASRSEGFPRSILEAMRAGLPVVATGVGGVAEAVAHGETGFVVPRGDLPALAISLQLLVRDSRMRVRMGLAGRRRYENNFTFERMSAQTIDLYHQVLKRTPHVDAAVGGGR
jgi:glycosyltransferase involved in cell wall biosynthesis